MECLIKTAINSGNITNASTRSRWSLGQLYGRISLRSKAAPINLPVMRGVMCRIGKEDSLQFVIGKHCSGELHEVTIWFNDNLLTPTDNKVFVPQFIASLRHEMSELMTGDINEDNFFLDLGPTTDDFSCRIKLSCDNALLTFDGPNDSSFIVSILVKDILFVYSKVIGRLEGIIQSHK